MFGLLLIDPFLRKRSQEKNCAVKAACTFRFKIHFLDVVNLFLTLPHC